jgi:hypothetical protein
MQAKVGDHAIFFRKAAVRDHLRGQEVSRRSPGRDPGLGPGRSADLRKPGTGEREKREAGLEVSLHAFTLSPFYRSPPSCATSSTLASPLTLSEVRAMLPAGITADLIPPAEQQALRNLHPPARTCARLFDRAMFLRPADITRRRGSRFRAAPAKPASSPPDTIEVRSSPDSTAHREAAGPRACIAGMRGKRRWPGSWPSMRAMLGRRLICCGSARTL